MREPTIENGWFGGFGPFGGQRAQRGDIGPIIQDLLKEKPMHGYEIIRTLEERTHGMWRPSAGSVYPTLQMLEEQGLVVSEETDGKKVYSLTEKGRQELPNSRPVHPWEGKFKGGQQFREEALTVKEIMMSLRQIAFHGSEADFAEARTILKDTRDRLSVLVASHKL
jgi:DNA-binding PadR family transcriptional regulator